MAGSVVYGALLHSYYKYHTKLTMPQGQCQKGVNNTSIGRHGAKEGKEYTL
jgi:hypothetical protein